MIPTDHVLIESTPRSAGEQHVARRALGASGLSGMLTTWRHVAGPHPQPRYALVEASNA